MQNAKFTMQNSSLHLRREVDAEGRRRERLFENKRYAKVNAKFKMKFQFRRVRRPRRTAKVNAKFKMQNSKCKIVAFSSGEGVNVVDG